MESFRNSLYNVIDITEWAELFWRVMNEYLKNLSKIEFVVTDLCTGRCKHCSQGDHRDGGAKIDPHTAALAVRKIAARYKINTVLAFGGEPLLHTDAVFAIMNAARESNIQRRQIITNGCFSQDAGYMREVAQQLSECGVNDLLLSVDAFHEETLPIDTVKTFAVELKNARVPTRLQPAWLVNRDDQNPYNLKTRLLLDSFSDIDISQSEGNIVFSEGNAAKFLAEYFAKTAPENPYIEDEYDLRCISFSANGDVLGENVYRSDIMEIIKNYAPQGC